MYCGGAALLSTFSDMSAVCRDRIRRDFRAVFGSDFRFSSPQLDTSLQCETTDSGLVHRVVCLFISLPSR